MTKYLNASFMSEIVVGDDGSLVSILRDTKGNVCSFGSLQDSFDFLTHVGEQASKEFDRLGNGNLTES